MANDAPVSGSDQASATDAAKKNKGQASSKPASSNPTTAAAIDSVKQATSQAKDSAAELLGQVKDQAASQVDQRRQTVASGMQAVAQAFHSMGDDLKKNEQGPVAEYTAEIGHAIGGQVEQLANYLRDRDLNQLVADTEDFARRSPAVFLGGAFVLGLAVSRFLKSSRPGSGRTGYPALGAGSPQLALPPASTPSTSAGANTAAEFPFGPLRTSEQPEAASETVPAPAPQALSANVGDR